METLSRAPMKWSAFCIVSASSSILYFLSSTRHYLSTTQLILHPAKTSETTLVTTTLGKPTLRHDNSRYDSQWFPRRLWLRLSRWLCNNQTSRRTHSFRYNTSDEGLMHATRQSFNSRNDAVTTHLLESISSSTSPAQQQWCTIDDTFNNIFRASTTAWATDATTDTTTDFGDESYLHFQQLLATILRSSMGLTHEDIGVQAQRHLLHLHLLHLLLPLVNITCMLHFFFSGFWEQVLRTTLLQKGE